MSADPRANECLEYRRHPVAAMGGGMWVPMICLWALSPMVLSAFLEPGFVIDGVQGREAEGRASSVAITVVLAVGPGGFELPARAGALFIN